MIAAIPTFREVWFRARRERRVIVAKCLLADDRVAVVRVGPRGGFRILDETERKP
jgi:hypothetical protein